MDNCVSLFVFDINGKIIAQIVSERNGAVQVHKGEPARGAFNVWKIDGMDRVYGYHIELRDAIREAEGNGYRVEPLENQPPLWASNRPTSLKWISWNKYKGIWETFNARTGAFDQTEPLGVGSK